ncbi:MAG TPA: TlpA family protein disulfide reductase, partial [Spirochaetales bacterium]|nr:TlpA family protein disulfide reductase [Spirochaetales bacterium]
AEEEKGPVMPNLPLTRLDGTMTSVYDVREGKPVIINYFASWCPPCKQELPHFQKAFDEYGDQISFIFLDALDGQRETLKTVTAFIRDFPFTGPVFYDKGEFAMTFQTTSLPTTVFIDKEGRVVKGYLGFVPEEVLFADIAQLLN